MASSATPPQTASRRCGAGAGSSSRRRSCCFCSSSAAWRKDPEQSDEPQGEATPAVTSTRRPTRRARPARKLPSTWDKAGTSLRWPCSKMQTSLTTPAAYGVVVLVRSTAKRGARFALAGTREPAVSPLSLVVCVARQRSAHSSAQPTLRSLRREPRHSNVAAWPASRATRAPNHQREEHRPGGRWGTGGLHGGRRRAASAPRPGGARGPRATRGGSLVRSWL